MKRQDILTQLVENMMQIRRLVSVPVPAFAKDMPTLSQMGALSVVEAGGGVTDIALRFHISVPAATQLVNALVKKGFLIRTKNKIDARQVSLSFTKKGRAELYDIKRMHAAIFSKIFSSLNDKELLALDRLQKKIVQNLKTDSR